jgi:hydrogenase-1 operon protein HyaF
MTRLNEIPIQIVNMEEEITGSVVALLHEVARLQQRFLEKGENGQIDLKSLPLTQAEQQALTTVLATGEVEARLDALGRSEVRETRLPGVWWIVHYNIEGDLIAELIEVCRVPEILHAADEEIRRGAQALADLLENMAEDIDVTREQEDEKRPNLG